MDSDFNVFVEFVKSVAVAGGPWAMLGVALAGLVRILQLGIVQKVLGWISPKLLWASWPDAIKLLVPFVLAFLASLLPAIAAGTSLLVAVGGAIMAAVTAVGVHFTTKEAGSVVDQALVAANTDYQPGVVRKALSPVLPINEDAFKEKMLNPVR